MPTQYSVVQYVPDPLTGERINIGLIAIGATRVASRFLSDWGRVECFAPGKDIAFLRELASEIEEMDPSQLGLGSFSGYEGLDTEALAAISHRWHNVVQLTPPSPSMSDPDSLIEKLAPRFLRLVHQQVTPRVHLRTRATAARIAQRALELALEYKQVTAIVHHRALLAGRLESYRFDAVAEHLSPLVVTHGFSFESENEDEAMRNVDAFGMAIRDVRDKLPTLPIGVVALVRAGMSPPKAYERAAHLFEGMGAVVLHENSVVSWAEDQLETINAAVGGGEDGEGGTVIPLFDRDEGTGEHQHVA